MSPMQAGGSGSNPTAGSGSNPAPTGSRSSSLGAGQPMAGAGKNPVVSQAGKNPQGASSSGDDSDIDARMKRINELNQTLRGNVLEYKIEKYLELKKEYQDMYEKEINKVDTLLMKYSAYMDTSLLRMRKRGTLYFPRNSP